MSRDDRTAAAVPGRLGSSPPPGASEAEENGELPAGSRAGEYILRGTIASGGCGTVYAAEHRILGRRAAVKVLHRALASSEEMIERFLREARVVNQIRHPNIVDIHDFGELPDGRPYYVMELLGGASLRALIVGRGRFSPLEACGLLEPICAALGAAHAHGVVHRDLKASNVVVVREGDKPEVKLLDFGIAKLLRDTPGERVLTAVGQRLGTPYGMAPEQVRGEPVDARADLYALGVMLFQILTGRYPFEGDDPLQIERQHVEALPPRPSLYAPVPPAVDAVVLRCLEKDRELRYPSAAAVLEGLRAALGLPALDPGLPRKRQAAGIWVEVRLENPAAQDDALMDRLAAVLDETERLLAEGGFVPWLQTGSAILGVRLLSEDARAARAERREAVLRARQIHALSQRGPGEAGLRLVVQVHAATLNARVIAGAPEILGGPLVEPEGWVDERRGDFYATAQVLEGLESAGASS